MPLGSHLKPINASENCGSLMEISFLHKQNKKKMKRRLSPIKNLEEKWFLVLVGREFMRFIPFHLKISSMAV